MESYAVNICNRIENLPLIELPSGIKIAFFNLHGNQSLTEFCAIELAKKLQDCDVLITAESKGLQLAHCVARELKQNFYAVARKTKKLYLKDCLETQINSSITTGEPQKLFLSQFDADLLKGKRVAIIDDVISTGNSLAGLVDLVNKSGGILCKQAFVLAEGDAKNYKDIIYLSTIPIL